MLKNKITSQSLLHESEITQLIYAAPVNNFIQSSKLSQGRAGEQLSSQTGSGSDFAEVRPYQQGDEPRQIDWRATARSQTPLLRTFYSELSQPLCLLIDRRSAMRFATRGRLKVTQALRMALWLGGREARSGREISAVLLDNPCHWLPPQQGMLSLKLIAKLANTPCPPSDPDTDAINWNKIISGLEQHIAKGSQLILLSDFSGLQEKHNKLLGVLGNHCITTAIHISDASETIEGLNNSLFHSGSLQLHWGKKTSHYSSSSLIKRELKKRSEMMNKMFNKAKIKYAQLSVERDELLTFWSEVNQ